MRGVVDLGTGPSVKCSMWTKVGLKRGEIRTTTLSEGQKRGAGRGRGGSSTTTRGEGAHLYLPHPLGYPIGAHLLPISPLSRRRNWLCTPRRSTQSSPSSRCPIPPYSPELELDLATGARALACNTLHLGVNV
jgi:hypothetical protein